MPVYDFKCSECSTVFEIKRSPRQLDDVRCPECDAPAKRVFTPVGAIFKGSGFHTTDYRKQPAGATKSHKCPSADSSSSECSSCPASDSSD